MDYVKLGKTGIKISRIGFGTWGISGDWGRKFSKKEILRLFNVAFELGINFFDTAPVYGNGYVEEILGEFSKNHKIIIATKIPGKRKPSLEQSVNIDECYNTSYINTVLSKSLQRLNRKYVDLLMLHNWHPQWNKTACRILQHLNKLKMEGKIRAMGISLPAWMNKGLDDLTHLALLDFVMVPLNLFQQWARYYLLSTAQKKNIAILARSPLDHGSLAGVLHRLESLPNGDIRKRKFQGKTLFETQRRVTEICKKLRIDLKKLPAYALQFCLAQPAVVSVIVGMRSEQVIRDNIKNLKINFTKDQIALGETFEWNRGQ